MVVYTFSIVFLIIYQFPLLRVFIFPIFSGINLSLFNFLGFATMNAIGNFLCVCFLTYTIKKLTQVARQREKSKIYTPLLMLTWFLILFQSCSFLVDVSSIFFTYFTSNSFSGIAYQKSGEILIEEESSMIQYTGFLMVALRLLFREVIPIFLFFSADSKEKSLAEKPFMERRVRGIVKNISI